MFREREISEVLFWVVEQCQVTTKPGVVPMEMSGRSGVGTNLSYCEGHPHGL